MALYFESENFGQLCFPKINYEWFTAGFGSVRGGSANTGLVRTDAPITQGISNICPYDLIGKSAVGAYAELLHGVTDSVAGTVDVGIIKVDADNYSIYTVATGETPVSGQSVQFPFLAGISISGFEDLVARPKYNLYFGAIYYDDNESLSANLIFFSDYHSNIYDMKWNGATIALEAYYYGTISAPGVVNCSVTDEQVSFLNLPDIFPSVQEFDITRADINSVAWLSTVDITTANGGASYGLPVGFEGNYSVAVYGNGSFSEYSDSLGNPGPYTDDLLNCGLVDIYNPNAGDLRQLAHFLNSSNFYDVLSKTWSNPLESIISLSEFPVAPSNVTTANLILGGIDTEVSTNKLVSQHTAQLNFGTIDFTTYGEYFGSFLDYEPFTSATLFLPYIGFMNLQINNIQKTKIKLDYNIDFLNGDCVALIETTDGIKRTIETAHGNISIQIPLTSTNYTGIYQGLLSTVGNVASGNVLGVANDIISPKVSHNVTGGIGGSAGALGHVYAYILLNRPKQVYPNYYNHIIGKPLETGGFVSEYSGLTVGRIDISAMQTATAEEKEEIKRLFESGVVL